MSEATQESTKVVEEDRSERIPTVATARLVVTLKRQPGFGARERYGTAITKVLPNAVLRLLERFPLGRFDNYLI